MAFQLAWVTAASSTAAVTSGVTRLRSRTSTRVGARVRDQRLGVHGEDGVRGAGRRPHRRVVEERAVRQHAGPGPVPEGRDAADGVPGRLPYDVGVGPG